MTGLDAATIERFRGALAHRVGLSFDDSRLAWLSGVLRRRSEATTGSVEALLARVEDPGTWRRELRALAPELTVSETYFFRNPDHFRVVEEVALPERAEARSVSGRLQVLSAGCASGEEAYSLAIVLRREIEQCQVSLSGIDLNPKALERAVRAHYSSWALRGVPTDLRNRWFRAQGQEFVLDASIRAAVTFEERNLLEDDPGFWHEERFDVIFCRNVLMYLNSEAARDVVARMARALAPGGFLFLGHAETLRGISQDFELRHTHETFYYQRRFERGAPLPAKAPLTLDAAGAAVVARAAPGWEQSWLEAVRGASDRINALSARMRTPDETPTATPTTGVGAARHRADIARTLELMQVERFAEARAMLSSLPDARRDPDILLLRAVLLTHGGDLGEAERVSTELLKIDETNAGAHYVTALCRESAGDAERAALHDELAARLDPAFAMPHLHLGLLARRAADAPAARREFARALRLLEREDASRVLLFGGGFSRDALAALCRAELLASGGTP